ncbi:MAG: hypothetical protein ACTSYB_17870 [Candidatus Helarchaeota archaeon]
MKKRRPVRFQLHRVDPRGTSSRCIMCGEKLKSVPGAYNIQYYAKCHRYVPRHGNSALAIARRAMGAAAEG